MELYKAKNMYIHSSEIKAIMAQRPPAKSPNPKVKQLDRGLIFLSLSSFFSLVPSLSHKRVLMFALARNL
jgi:uncharacterized membrane-anchored protein